MDSSSLTSNLAQQLNPTPLSSDQQSFAQVSQNEPSSRSDQLYEPSPVSTGVFILPFVGWFILIGSILMAFFKSNKPAQATMLHRPGQMRSVAQKNKHLVPCSQCHYFSSNAYVHCALHPSKVLTSEAIDCSDYRNTTSRK
jgi:hypothetical protein